MANPKTFSWVAPTINTDGSAFVASEITGYTVGIRSTTAVGSVAGTYPTLTAAGLATSLALPTLVPGNYAAAVRADGLVPSAWSTEALFTVVPPTPSAPTLFTVA